MSNDNEFWSYIIKKKLKEKRMWNYVDGIFVKSIDKKDETKYAKEFET